MQHDVICDLSFSVSNQNHPKKDLNPNHKGQLKMI